MKKTFLILILFISCQDITNHFDSSNVVGRYDGKLYDNIFKLELTDSKNYIFISDISTPTAGTYSVDSGQVNLNEGNGIVEKLKIVNKNTLQFITANSNTVSLYRLGSPEEVANLSNSK